MEEADCRTGQGRRAERGAPIAAAGRGLAGPGVAIGSFEHRRVFGFFEDAGFLVLVPIHFDFDRGRSSSWRCDRPGWGSPDPAGRLTPGVRAARVRAGGAGTCPRGPRRARGDGRPRIEPAGRRWRERHRQGARVACRDAPGGEGMPLCRDRGETGGGHAQQRPVAGLGGKGWLARGADAGAKGVGASSASEVAVFLDRPSKTSRSEPVFCSAMNPFSSSEASMAGSPAKVRSHVFRCSIARSSANPGLRANSVRSGVSKAAVG